MLSNISRKLYIFLSIILVSTLILGGFFVLLSLQGQSPPDGGPTGLSEGATIFDLQRPKPEEVQYKLQAAQDTVNNPQNVGTSLQHAIKADPTDAEAQIYLENWQVLGSNNPHITLVVGVSFASYPGGARGTLQGAFVAQKEYNDQNWQNSSKTLIVLMIANVGGYANGNSDAKSAAAVADQIVDQVHKDPTIIAIIGWENSADTINVNRELKNKKSTLPMLSPSSSSDELGKMYNIFRICPPNQEQAQIAANFLLNTKQKKRIAILFDQTDSYSNTLQNDLANHIPKANIVSQTPFTGGDPKTIQDDLNTVLYHHPDAIFFAGYVSDLVELLNALPQTNNLLIVGGDALATTSDYKSLPSGLDRVYFTAFASPNQWDGINPKPRFFQEYQTQFGTLKAPTGLPSIDADVMLGYDALLTVLNSFQKVLSVQNTISPSDLTLALKQITSANPFQGITGLIAFEDNGDQQGKRVILEHIEGTSLVIDETHGCLQKDNCSS